MMGSQHLILQIEDHILTITINREKKYNALSTKTLEELKEAIQQAYDDEKIKGVIITGKGDKAFVAGADVEEIAALTELNSRKFAENGQEVFSLIENCYKPIIAAVNGFALGGGCELAMACHLRVAVKHAQFGLPEVKLGLIPGYGGTQRLPQLVGKGKAMEMMLTGEMIDAQEALDYGLVNKITSSVDTLYSSAKELINKILSNSPIAIGMVINSINAAFNAQEDGYQIEANSFRSATKSEDFQEGTRAFLEKRKPNFTGK